MQSLQLGPEDIVSDGDTIDREIGAGRATTIDVKPADRRRERQSAGNKAREAKAGPPSLDEWTGFFSRVVMRFVTEWYINYAFRGIDEDALSERELDRIMMTDEERDLIVVPFAELSNKSKFMRKHGRTIVASGDAFNAVVVFGMWTSRVNRIANRHRPRNANARTVVNGSAGTSESASASETNGSTGGRVANGFHVYNPSGG